MFYRFKILVNEIESSLKLSRDHRILDRRLYPFQGFKGLILSDFVFLLKTQLILSTCNQREVFRKTHDLLKSS